MYISQSVSLFLCPLSRSVCLKIDALFLFVDLSVFMLTLSLSSLCRPCFFFYSFPNRKVHKYLFTLLCPQGATTFGTTTLRRMSPSGMAYHIWHTSDGYNHVHRCAECHHVGCCSAKCHSCHLSCPVLLCSILQCHYAKCHFTECRFADCQSPECHSTERYSAECQSLEYHSAKC